MQEKNNLIINEIKKVIHGKDNIIRLTLSAILAKGHVLLEDIPGVGKTTMAMAFAESLSMNYRRMQFTPDVLPSDLVGFNMFDKSSESFRYQEGAVYTNLFLADEINRTSPKTQSALLEVMEEGKATVEGVTRPLPTPFFVIATENPYGSSGTQKLPESQLDRFMVCLSIGYPDSESAVNILKNDSSINLKSVEKIISSDQLIEMQNEVQNLFVSDELFQYVVALTESTRDPGVYDLGLSPRGSIALLKMAKAYAYVNGKNFLSPEDIQDVFLPVTMHRVKLSGKSRAAGLSLEDALTASMKSVNIPTVNTSATAKK